MDAGMWKDSSKAVPAVEPVNVSRRRNMLLYFRHKLERLGMSYHQFFETAYQWKFNPPQLPSLSDDYCQFLLHSVLPKYVVEFLNHLQQEEMCQSNAPVVTVPSLTSQR